MNLPMIPTPSTALTISDVISIEREIANRITTIENVDALEEMRAKADALARYLSGKELHGPMLGAQRRIEARLGQLLGEARVGNPSITGATVIAEIPRDQRICFRLLARGFDVLADEEWRQTRKKLLAYLREKYPVPKHQPEVVVLKDGRTKKTRDKRVAEIAALAQKGNRAAQIAETLSLSEQQVRRLAKVGGVALPDVAIGRTRHLDAKRVLTETINGVDAYVSGLSMLDGAALPELSTAERTDLLQALSRSINGLRKLRTKLTEDVYAGSDSTAA